MTPVSVARVSSSAGGFLTRMSSDADRTSRVSQPRPRLSPCRMQSPPSLSDGTAVPTGVTPEATHPGRPHAEVLAVRDCPRGSGRERVRGSPSGPPHPPLVRWAGGSALASLAGGGAGGEGGGGTAERGVARLLSRVAAQLGRPRSCSSTAQRCPKRGDARGPRPSRRRGTCEGQPHRCPQERT